MNRNAINTTVTLSRRQLCDLILACGAAYIDSRASKWIHLRDYLKSSLKALDQEIDGIPEEDE